MAVASDHMASSAQLGSTARFSPAWPDRLAGRRLWAGELSQHGQRFGVLRPRKAAEGSMASLAQSSWSGVHQRFSLQHPLARVPQRRISGQSVGPASARRIPNDRVRLFLGTCTNPNLCRSHAPAQRQPEPFVYKPAHHLPVPGDAACDGDPGGNSARCSTSSAGGNHHHH